jgi:hypothetical protein
VPGLDRIPTHEAEDSGSNRAEFQVDVRVRGLHFALLLRMSCCPKRLADTSGRWVSDILLRDFVAAMVCSLMFTRQLKIDRSLEFCMPLWLWLLSRMLFQILSAFF